MNVTLSPVEPDDVDAVQAVIESDPAYVERVTGLPPGPADAQSLLMMRPSDLAEDRKVVLGVRRGGVLVGLVDVLRGYPEADTAYLGLLQIRGDLQRQGLGRAAHDALLAYVRGWPEIRRVRLAVVATNDPVAGPFWCRLGYAPVGEPVPYTYDKLSTTAQRYELVLPSMAVDDTRSRRDEPVRLVPHDPAWSARFTEEAVRLQAVIGPWITGGIHHVGSTAVPGLDAKPVIDIAVGVESLEASRPCIDRLGELDYLYAPYRAEVMHWFCKPDPARRTHQLHLIPTDSTRLEDEIIFRDYLIAHPARAAEYGVLKRRLAVDFVEDRDAYTSAKSDFVESVVAAARAWRAGPSARADGATSG